MQISDNTQKAKKIGLLFDVMYLQLELPCRMDMGKFEGGKHRKGIKKDLEFKRKNLIMDEKYTWQKAITTTVDLPGN